MCVFARIIRASVVEALHSEKCVAAR